MNDHRNHRHRASDPAWPTGDDSDPRASARAQEEAPERTGFWSPLWEDEDDESGRRQSGSGHAPGGAPGGSGHSNGRSNGPGRHGAADHQWPDAEPPAAPRRPEPPAPPRPASRSAAPAWPSADTGAPGGPGAPGPRRPGGPHTPPPGMGHPNGAPGPNSAPGPAGGRPPAGPGAGPTTRIVRPRPAGPPRSGGPGAPGVDPEGPTELLEPVRRSRGNGPEPSLLTHRELDYDEDLNDDPDLDDDYAHEDDPLSAGDRKKLRRKKIWRRVRRTAYVMTALGIIVPVAGFFAAYQMVEVPNPEAVAADQGQVVTLKWANGQPMSTIVPPKGNRTMVTYDELPDTVKHAVFAAEDAEFMTNPGFDITGVMQAGLNQVTGGDGGGSTITQQYIKKATGEDEVSLSRKALEIVKAYKMNKTYSKEEIITAYLNTIYFGRGANGIVAAGQAYFKKSLDQLTPSQAALLAGMIQNPSRYTEQAYMERRWKFVMGQMVAHNWITAAEQSSAKFPQPIDIKEARPAAVEGPAAHIQSAVLEEVKRDAGLTLEDLQKEGLTVQTTIDPYAQTFAQNAVDSVMADEPKNLLPAMVAIDPKTGGVIAYYGGSNGLGLDWAEQPQEPGSSFKPFDLVALLEQGKGLGEIYNGTSGRIFDGRKVRNSDGASCGEQCTVAEAMRRSINTVFYDIALNTVGTKRVADAAKQSGITSQLLGPNGAAPDANISIGGGKTLVSTYEMASAYATFAANGTYRKPHMVAQIVDAKGQIVWQPTPGTYDGSPAFDKGDAKHNKQIARNVTESLKPVLTTSKLECAGKRECAGKTGTHQLGATEDNAKAWMVGYSPQISTAVSMAAEDNNKQVALKNVKGKIVYGSGLPGEIWKKFMDDYLKDKPKEGFGKVELIGKPIEKPDDSKDKKDKSDNNRPTDDNNDGRPTDGNNQSSNPPSTEQSGPDGGGPGGPGGPGDDPTDSDDPPIPTLGGLAGNGNGNGPGRR